MWKEAVMAQFNVLSQHVPGENEETHKNSQSGKSVSGSRFKPWTSEISSRSASH